MSQAYISDLFLSRLLECHQDSWEGDRGWELQVRRPEGGEAFPLRECLITFGPEVDQITVTYQMKTVSIFTRKWNSLHAENGVVEFRKDEVAYRFVRRRSLEA